MQYNGLKVLSRSQWKEGRKGRRKERRKKGKKEKKAVRSESGKLCQINKTNGDHLMN